MIKKWGGVLALFLLLGSLAAAEGTGYGYRGDRDEMRGRLKTELGLTKDQETKLETHRIDHRAEMEKLMLVVKDKREELKTALENPQMDKGAVERINDELKDAQNDMADKRLEGILYVRGVLTPDQFKKFLALHAEHREKEGGRWGQDKKSGHAEGPAEGSKHKRHDGDRDDMDEDSMGRPNSR